VADLIVDRDRFYAEREGNGDNITATAYGEHGEIHLRIEEPWSGDTETGFGAICGMTLTRAEATALGEWIRNVLSGDQQK
jgi:hypothetical protein